MYRYMLLFCFNVSFYVALLFYCIVVRYSLVLPSRHSHVEYAYTWDMSDCATWNTSGKQVSVFISCIFHVFMLPILHVNEPCVFHVLMPPTIHVNEACVLNWCKSVLIINYLINCLFISPFPLWHLSDLKHTWNITSKIIIINIISFSWTQRVIPPLDDEIRSFTR